MVQPASLGLGGDDTLDASASTGSNLLLGGAGNDTLKSGSGNDILSGGAGNDTFKFAATFGNDVVTDFQHGQDIIDVATSDFADLAAVLTNAVQSGADTIVTHDAGNSVTLKNVVLATLTADDFRFT
jgi:Ca2+-binding RTX toxin-like protein